MPKGFYKVSVEAPSMDIPVLPYRTSEGKLIFPLGSWEGTYYSDELLLAKEHGYTITPIEGVVFSKSKDFLREYVDDFTKIKNLGGVYHPIQQRGMGFEPMSPMGLPVFKTGALNRSASPPSG